MVLFFGQLAQRGKSRNLFFRYFTEKDFLAAPHDKVRS
jgi:hypothetical protein